VLFDKVEVPYERLFIDCNLAVYNYVMSQTWWHNIMQQTTIRALTKLEFAWGIATHMADAINASQPPTQQVLGEIWTYAEMTRACLQAAEDGAADTGNGVWLPDKRPFTALRATMPGWMVRVNEIIKELGSHNIFTVPSRGELDDPVLRPLIDHHLTGAGGVARARAAIFRLAGFRWHRARGSQRTVRTLLPHRLRAAIRWADVRIVLGNELVGRFLNEPLS
jgi:aromatic ring hydroxylase